MSPDAGNNEAAYAQHMRAQWMGSISALARQLPDIRLPDPDSEEQLEDIVTRMCEGCDRLPQCWHEHASGTRAAMTAYFIEGDRSARMPDCVRREGWPALALDSERASQQRQLRYLSIRHSLRLTARHTEQTVPYHRCWDMRKHLRTE